MTPVFSVRSGKCLSFIDPLGARLSAMDARADLHVASFRGLVDYDAPAPFQNLADGKWNALARGIWVSAQFFDHLLSFSQERSFAGEHVATSSSWNVKFFRYTLVNELLEPVSDIALHQAGEFSEGVAPALIFDDQNKENVYERPRGWGLMGRDGKWSVSPRYDHICDFRDGLAEFKVDDRHGYLRSDGSHLVGPSYRATTNFFNGFAQVRHEEGNSGGWGIIDREGQLVHPFCLPSRSSVGLYGAFEHSNDRVAFKDEGKWGFAKIGYGTVIPPQFDAAGNFKDGLAKVYLKKKCGFIDPDGNVAIPFRFASGFDFQQGLACVQAKVRISSNPVKSALRWGYIDSTGQWVIEPQFKHASGFYDDHALVWLDDSIMALIDRKGNKIWAD